MKKTIISREQLKDLQKNLSIFLSKFGRKKATLMSTQGLFIGRETFSFMDKNFTSSVSTYMRTRDYGRLSLEVAHEKEIVFENHKDTKGISFFSFRLGIVGKNVSSDDLRVFGHLVTIELFFVPNNGNVEVYQKVTIGEGFVVDPNNLPKELMPCASRKFLKAFMNCVKYPAQV